MRFKGLDLNLLAAFDVLLDECSVSRAAVRLNLSQSATSAALFRLRDFFGDPILIVQGRQMTPTPYAESLHPMVRTCLSDAEMLIAASTAFDPATSRRIFRTVASDYAMAALLVAFTHAISEQAPHIGFDFFPPDASSIKKLDRGEVDLLIVPEAYAAGAHAVELLFEDSHVVMGWDRHPVFNGKITEDSVLRFKHVAVALDAARTLSFGDQYLAHVESRRQIAITTASFTILPGLLIGSDKLAIVPSRLAAAMAKHLPIRFASVPFDIPILREMMQYHRSRANDDGVIWLRSELRSFINRKR